MSNWHNTLFVVPRGDLDYYKRFCLAYTAVGRWIQQVRDDAQTSEADIKVLRSAGALLADFDDWAMRAVNAMRKGNPRAFHALIAEARELRLVNEETGEVL